MDDMHKLKRSACALGDGQDKDRKINLIKLLVRGEVGVQKIQKK